MPEPSASAATDDMKSEIILDCRNLTAECLEALNGLSRFAYPGEDVFIFEEYRAFAYDKKLVELYETLSALAGRTHSLKGLMGFLSTDGKALCHAIEDVIKLAHAVELVFDEAVFRLIQSYLYKVQDLLDAMDGGRAAEAYVESWTVGIDYVIRRNQAALAEEREAFRAFVAARVADSGEVRRRKKVELLSVLRDGYDELLEKVTELIHVVASVRGDAALARTEQVYNEIVSLHQSIKQAPLDLSRYERLVQNLAAKQRVKANLHADVHGVRANAEFWQSIHEILSHLLKNALIHGIEPPLERLRADKPEHGQLEVALREDALNIYLVLRDDGRGIDVERLKAKALQAGALPRERLEAMGHEELLQLVFLQGLSTRETVDDDAGRGVGLLAVTHAVERLDGELCIASQAGRGTTWQCVFPKKNVSLPSFVVRSNDQRYVIIETHVDKFARRDAARMLTLQGRPHYRDDSGVVPLITLDGLVNPAEPVRLERPFIVFIDTGSTRFGIPLDAIEKKAILFVKPIEVPFALDSVAFGVAIYQNRPIVALDCGKLKQHAAARS